MVLRFICRTYTSSGVAIVFAALALAAGFLYSPFLGGAVIFDDHGLFSNLRVYEFAQEPVDFKPRTFPYFTIGFIHVLSESLAVNRAFNVVLHVACLGVLFVLLRSLLAAVFARSEMVSVTKRDTSIHALSALAVLCLAIHPIAVYGVAYLAQRTGLFATLFSLLSLWFFRRAFAENRNADIFTAALFYSLAVFSKEHVIMLPLAALPLTALYEGSWRAHCKRMVLFLALCIPAALTILFATKAVVASSYEPDAAAMLSQMQNITLMAHSRGEWLVSIVLQAGFFFDYLAFWIVPDVRVLSVDMRFDFVHIWSSWWIFPKAFLFFVSPLIAIYYLHKKGLVALFCCGYLYVWFLFMTELAAVRFQEPFVLYRSYLWAPGYAMMMVAVCARVPRRWLLMAAIPLFAILFMLARDRLASLATEADVWKDAAAKLAAPTLMGSDRIFYNRGLAYMREKRYDDAIADFSRTVQLSPRVAPAYYNRALAYYSVQKYAEALADLDHTLSLNPKDRFAHYARGSVLEREGCTAAARRAFTASLAMGNVVAQLKLDDMEKKPAGSESRPSDASTCPN